MSHKDREPRNAHEVWLREILHEGFSGLHFHIEALEDKMSQLTDEIKAEVAKNRDVTRSAITLLRLLLQKVQDAVNDPAALQDILNEVKADSEELAAAVVENTPAEPNPT